MLRTSLSASWMPSSVAACCLDAGPGGHATCRRAGRSAEELAGGDGTAGTVVHVLPQEDLVRRVGRVGLALVHPGRVGVVARPGCHRAVPRTPSGPAWFWPRVSTMKRRCAGRRSSRVAEDVVRTGDQRVIGLERHEDGSAALDGLVHAVVEELAEEGEQRVVGRRQPDVGGDVRDEQRAVGRHAAAGAPATGGVASGSGSVVQGTTPSLPWVRTGKPAAGTAAGLVDVWSTIRLLMVRGCESKTFPDFCA